MPSTLLKAALLASAPLSCLSVTFTPEQSSILSGGLSNLPIPYDVAGSMYGNSGHSIGDSFWSTSFLHGSDDHDYMVLSHAVRGLPFTPAMFRGSIYDITAQTYQQFTYLSNNTDFYADNGNGAINVTLDNFGYGATQSTNAETQLRTFSTAPEVQYDLTFQLGTPALLNGGLGFFACPNSNLTCQERSSPSDTTTGSLVVNGTTVTVDPTRSLTWFDRQWGNPVNWTWFELHLQTEGTESAVDTKLSIWIYPDNNGTVVQLATIRETQGVQNVEPVLSFVPGARTYTSPETGSVYSLDHELSLLDDTNFLISSPHDNQEMRAGNQIPTYEGYITVTGTYKGKTTTGFGVVEILPLLQAPA
ncbi:hypothetical protein ACEPPN_012982 [Leptodophora sp. 'Broadleaf-Isolate-01']